MTAMLVESERLGPLEVDEASVIEVPAGLIGFPQLRRFALGVQQAGRDVIQPPDW